MAIATAEGKRSTYVIALHEASGLDEVRKLMPIRSWNAVIPDMDVNCSAMKSRK